MYYGAVVIRLMVIYEKKKDFKLFNETKVITLLYFSKKPCYTLYIFLFSHNEYLIAYL